MTSCKICKSLFHNTSDCNLLDSYLTIVSSIFFDYHSDRHKENLQKRLHEITKNWKNSTVGNILCWRILDV